MYQRLRSVGWEPHVNKFRGDQKLTRSTWNKVGNGEQAPYANMHSIQVAPKNASTELQVNPLDPNGDHFVEVPGAKGSVARSGIWQGY